MGNEAPIEQQVQCEGATLADDGDATLDPMSDDLVGP